VCTFFISDITQIGPFFVYGINILQKDDNIVNC